MIKLRNTFNLIERLIDYNLCGSKYSLSIYNIIEKYGENYIIFNTLSRAVVLLNEEELSVLKNIKNIDLSNPLIIECIKLHFIVDSSVDEVNRYLQIYNFNKIINASSKKINTFKIYTTTHCNARCFYCFEEGIKKENMSDETIDAVIKYIYNNKAEKIKLYWFGGEPLCNQKVINKICADLKSNDVDFESTIISNSYLFDSDLINKAVCDWNLTFVQVTLDGYGEEHNIRKAYVNPNADPFMKTIENIHLLKNAGVRIIVRLNFDKNNFENIKKLIMFLKNEFVDFKNVTVSPVLLIDNCFMHKTESVSPDLNESNEYLLELQEMLYKEKMLHFSPLENRLRTHKCMADSEQSVTISTDGKFFTCQNCEEEMCYGNIYDGVTNIELLNSWRKNYSVREKCKKCPFLPECTPFDKCPVERDFCVNNNRYRIRKKMIATADAYFKNMS